MWSQGPAQPQHKAHSQSQNASQGSLHPGQAQQVVEVCLDCGEAFGSVADLIHHCENVHQVRVLWHHLIARVAEWLSTQAMPQLFKRWGANKIQWDPMSQGALSVTP